MVFYNRSHKVSGIARRFMAVIKEYSVVIAVMSFKGANVKLYVLFIFLSMQLSTIFCNH